MPRVESQMIELGTIAPSFELSDGLGRTYSLDDAQDAKAILVAFICNHCPFVKHLAGEFSTLASEYAQEGLATFAIMPNDITTHPADSPEAMMEEAALRGYEFPYVFDEDQSVAKAYRAMCTPDFYLFDGDRKLVYRGQFDDSRPEMGVATGKDLRDAVIAVLDGKTPTEEQQPSLGCNIKWIPGREPDYA